MANLVSSGLKSTRRHLPASGRKSGLVLQCGTPKGHQRRGCPDHLAWLAVIQTASGVAVLPHTASLVVKSQHRMPRTCQGQILWKTLRQRPSAAPSVHRFANGERDRGPVSVGDAIRLECGCRGRGGGVSASRTSRESSGSVVEEVAIFAARYAKESKGVGEQQWRSTDMTDYSLRLFRSIHDVHTHLKVKLAPGDPFSIKMSIKIW